MRKTARSTRCPATTSWRDTSTGVDVGDIADVSTCWNALRRIDDADLDRTAVTPENAERLRLRMRRCSSLLYLATDDASRSKWMPWEVGFFDGLDEGVIGILPVLEDPTQEFEGMEFLGLYGVVDVRSVGIRHALFIKKKGQAPIRLKSLVKKAS
jgi:hypothetical protein